MAEPLITPEKYIEKAKLVTDFFGKWPDFHQAELISVFLYRNYPMEPKILMRVYAFEKIPAGLLPGKHKKARHCQIEFEFLGVKKNLLSGFNFINRYTEIKFSLQDEHVLCEFIPSSGAMLMIEAEKVRIRGLRKLVEDPKDTLDKF